MKTKTLPRQRSILSRQILYKALRVTTNNQDHFALLETKEKCIHTFKLFATFATLKAAYDGEVSSQTRYSSKPHETVGHVVAVVYWSQNLKEAWQFLAFKLATCLEL